MMLEQLGVQPGQRVLEIGAGTGYNAALLQHLVGDAGQVTTIDLDDDIVAGARTALAAAGYPSVRVVLGDGALGCPDGAPYDRVIATAGTTTDLPPAWLEQLAADGRLVVPARIRGSVTRSITFERAGDCWRSRDSEMCGFMPLRGTAADPRRGVALTAEGDVTLEVHPEQTVDQQALTGLLERPRDELWTGTHLGPYESAEWVWLWLACALPNALSRMPLQPSAIDRGLVRPMFGWGTMATTDGGALAYLTLRDTIPDDATTAGRRCEIGVIGQGPAAVVSHSPYATVSSSNANRVRASGSACFRTSSSTAWVGRLGGVGLRWCSHPETVEGCTRRCPANVRTFIRSASRSARVSRPVHRPTASPHPQPSGVWTTARCRSSARAVCVCWASTS
jgi:protein-L-isoaspartate(D-aspartate) O-methyltransferase